MSHPSIPLTPKGYGGTHNPGRGPVTEPMTGETYSSPEVMWKHEKTESKSERGREGHGYNY